MIVYSKKIVQFIAEIKKTIKTILAKEVGLKVGQNRFLDWRQRSSYPINVVIYNNKRMLGYFDSNFYELGFHESLMHKQQLHNIIRHELAHYLTFILHGDTIQPHGPEFRAFCEKMGWSEEVYRATICLEEGQPTSPVEESAILRKVQKLMALSTSSNEHEAREAMIKSQQLLLKHNLEAQSIDDDEKVFLKRIMKQKRESAKMRAIGKILETFFVSIVFSRGKEFTYLEILGDPVNVEIAEYVAAVLERELENLWDQAKRQAHLKGQSAKNSFFLGIAKGYCNKIQALKREYNTEVTSALIVLQNKLTQAQAMAYPHLSMARRGGSLCQASALLGERMGKELNINPALNRTSKSGLLIGFET
jgi:hypothetical protein